MLIREGTDPDRRRAFADLGVKLIEVAGAEAGVDPRGGLTALGAAGLTRVLVEGGAQLAASLLRADLVDRIAWFHAPAVMGGDALAGGAGVRHRAPRRHAALRRALPRRRSATTC